MAYIRFAALASILAFCGEGAAVAGSFVPDISTTVPEPSDFALFLMGVAGLVVGRRSARRRHRGDDDNNA